MPQGQGHRMEGGEDTHVRPYSTGHAKAQNCRSLDGRQMRWLSRLSKFAPRFGFSSPGSLRQHLKQERCESPMLSSIKSWRYAKLWSVAVPKYGYGRPRAPRMFQTALPARKNDKGNFTFGGLRNVEIHDHNCGRCHKRRIHRPPRPLPPVGPTHVLTRSSSVRKYSRLFFFILRAWYLHEGLPCRRQTCYL